MWRDSHPTEIKTICVKTRLDSDVMMIPFITVSGAGFVQQTKTIIGEIKQLSTEFGSKLCSSLPMVAIARFTDSPRVVEQRKQLDDFDVCSCLLGQPNSILQDSRPMVHTMIAVAV